MFDADHTELLSSTCISCPQWHSSIITCYLRQTSFAVSTYLRAFCRFENTRTMLFAYNAKLKLLHQLHCIAAYL